MGLPLLPGSEDDHRETRVPFPLAPAGPPWHLSEHLCPVRSPQPPSLRFLAPKRKWWGLWTRVGPPGAGFQPRECCLERGQLPLPGASPKGKAHQPAPHACAWISRESSH